MVNVVAVDQNPSSILARRVGSNDVILFRHPPGQTVRAGRSSQWPGGAPSDNDEIHLA
jgi:hypothetical protein